MPQCAVLNCNNTHRRTRGGSENVRYHRLPGDAVSRTKWLKLCGKIVANCSTARVCSRHFSKECYERDVQHELLGLPWRCRLKKGAVPDKNLPHFPNTSPEERCCKGARSCENLPVFPEIEILSAVGLVPINDKDGTLNKMRMMEEAKEGESVVQPSSPGHALIQNNSNIEKNQDNLLVQGVEIDDVVPNSDCATGCESENLNVCNQINTEVVIKEENIVNNSLSEEENMLNNDSNEDCSGFKRKNDEENVENDSPAKKLRAEIEENFVARDKILNDFMEMLDTENSSNEQLQINSEQLLAEIRTLNDLAREKEHEWNNIIHLKKIKEELLIRIERKRQIIGLNGEVRESDEDGNVRIKQATAGQSLLKHNISRTNSKLSKGTLNNFRYILPKNNENAEINGVNVAKNRPTLDVQSIIADHRQRHPETVPRRGRRIRSQNNGNGTDGNSNILNFASMAFGSGAQVRQNHNLHDVGNELSILLNALDNSRGSNADFPHDSTSFKDILVQFAKLSQNERNELLQSAMKPPPPPYPEVTVHPVTNSPFTTPTNSLLHGILTKSPSKANCKTSFSPTLARLLTAPERANNNHLTSQITANLSNLSHHQYPSNMSISEILSNSKARNEITITPVENQFEQHQTVRTAKSSSNTLEDEETGDADRLIIDESNEELRRNVDNSSENGEEVPQCQGCNLKTAQFVCAGCGNQWYCSRDCQVAAWDEHSEVCAG